MTLEDLRASARSKADEQATGFIDTTELDRFINQGMRFVYGKIAQRFENYFITEGTTANSGKFNTVAGTQGYSLPTTLMKLVRVESRTSSSTNDNDYLRVRTDNIANDMGTNFSPLREGYVPDFGYFIAGNKIYFKPVPQSAYTVRLWFIPRATALSLVSDTPSVPEEYHELIAEYAAIQCLAKSGEPIFKERQDAFMLELTNMLETVEVRDQQPETMMITDDSNDYYGI